MTENGENYNGLTKERQYARSKITRMIGKVKAEQNEDEPLSDSKRREYYDRLKSLQAELSSINKNIHAVLPPTVIEDTLMDEEDAYDDQITEALAMLNPSVEANGSDRSFLEFLNEGNTGNSTKLKLPTIILPHYSNDKSETLEKFFQAFEAIVDKHNLSNYEKFIYLKNQLHKGTLAIINSLDPTNQTYHGAKQLLTEAFGSPLTQKYEALDKLTKLKLDLNSDIYEFISQYRNLITSFHTLEIDINIVLQYFIWQAMNHRFQSHLISITNNSKPSLDEIQANIFAATERYKRTNDQFIERKSMQSKSNNFKASDSKGFNNTLKTNNCAINVDNKTIKPCNLCLADKKGKVTHSMSDCRTYVTPLEKVNKLNALNQCSLCSFANHNAKKCRFKFSSPCRHCKGGHMSFLCVSNPESSGSPTEKSGDFVANYTSCIRFDTTIQNDKILLPSFSVDISYNSGNVTKCRVLNDSGSQRNFILKRIAHMCKLPIVRKDVNMTVYGLNNKSTVVTDIVKVPITFGKNQYEVEAIVVPKIEIALKIPNLQVIVSEMKKNNLVLADQQLVYSGDTIAGFDLIMGPDALHILNSNSFIIGKPENKSVLMNTDGGLMLTGDSASLLSNLRLMNPHSLCEKPAERIRNKISAADSTKGNPRVHIKVCQTSHVAVGAEVLNRRGELDSHKLDLVAEDALQRCSDSLLNIHDSVEYDESVTEMNKKVVDYILTNTDRDNEGRLIMDLPWNPDNKHLLGMNYNLSKKVLHSNLNKLKANEKLKAYNNVFREQEEAGIIQRVDNVERYIEEHPECSFLPHMGIFKPDRETTKVRVVFLSNLCEKDQAHPNAVSHNQAMLPGPCLNAKLSTALLQSRFDRYMIIFDIKKAFLNIQLRPGDQNKLLFLWYKSVENNDFSLIAYKNMRLSFGLRPSPFVLMLGLYQMLIEDTENDSNDIIALKKLIYRNLYMDNGIISIEKSSELLKYFELLPKIFAGYKFELQQFATNCKVVQKEIKQNDETEIEEKVKLFGIQWNVRTDMLAPFSMHLNTDANTKRKILSSLNSVYDIFNVYYPILNKAKLFFQRLQADKSLKWDTVLDHSSCNEWHKICKSINSTPEMPINRYIGAKEGRFSLVAFSDSSGAIYGAVVYLHNLDTNEISFVCAKNRIIGTNLAKKSIPSLECQGIAFATEVSMELYEQLTGDSNLSPVDICNIYIYTDSMVCLAWLKSYFMKHDKMQKRSVFVLNRLKNIADLCEHQSITYRYIEGSQNPSDCVTRVLSHKQLTKTCYLTGPKFLKERDHAQPDLEGTVPNPLGKQSFCLAVSTESKVVDCTRNTAEDTVYRPTEHWLKVTEFSSFKKILNIYCLVHKYIRILKERVNRNLKGEAVTVRTGSKDRISGLNTLIRTEQNLYFPGIVQFFQTRDVVHNQIPNLVMQLNLFSDQDGIIRVKGKMNNNFPVLLSRESYLTELMISDLHVQWSHAGLFTVLKELRKNFWVLKSFSTVRRILKKCVTCRKLNERPINLNENCYRDFRVTPSEIPFSNIFLDYIGPLTIKVKDQSQKVWLLLITCLFTRAVNIKICYSADTGEFLRCLQMHVYEFGLFSLCLSDLGSRIVAGGNIVSDFVNEMKVKDFFSEHGIQKVEFEQYAKGNSSLGSLIESLVKQVKYLIIKSVGKTILHSLDFELLIHKVRHIVNRRPIAFREVLRNSEDAQDDAFVITPEMMIYGRELLSVNIIPQMQPEFGEDYAVRNEPYDAYAKLRKVNSQLNSVYHSEFIVNLLAQSTDRSGKYRLVVHREISEGDVVLLVETNTKRTNYPLGIVRKINKNALGEVTSAIIMKGSTREEVFRHTSSLILILKNEKDGNKQDTNTGEQRDISFERSYRPIRDAANKAKARIEHLYAEGSA